jgi:ubiquinone/menaquinone biosynthesis C-methylase UbiE
MPTVQELYELWAEDSELRETLRRSLEPRGTDWLFELFASLGPRAGELLVDVGCRDAKHTTRLVQEHGLRAVALDPLALHVERAQQAVADAGLEQEIDVVEGRIEALPLDDGAADWIWCRDVLVHVDVRSGLAECARVLRAGGRMVAYATLATELLEPRERAELVAAAAVAPESFTSAAVEAAAAEAGLSEIAVECLGGEWRERMIEDGTWDAAETLLGLSRLRRREREFVEAYGEGAVAAYRGGQLWGIYQLLGKLCPTVYVWERRA